MDNINDGDDDDDASIVYWTYLTREILALYFGNSQYFVAVIQEGKVGVYVVVEHSVSFPRLIHFELSYLSHLQSGITYFIKID